MEGIRTPATHKTPEEVFNDFKGRRAGLIKALTTDVQKFYQMCDPEKDNLCLYGLPNEAWEVSLPVEEVPPELPEPTLGINFARNGMEEQSWLYLVAVHSDSWLLAVAFYFGARFGFTKNERRRLFQMINDLPTVLETVAEYATSLNDQAEIRNRASKSKSSGKNSRPSQLPPKGMKMAAAAPKAVEQNIEEEDDEQGATCGACGDDNATDEFWICCDICEVWFHGKCVNVTPAKAAFINQYKCPTCTAKKARLQD